MKHLLVLLLAWLCLAGHAGAAEGPCEAQAPLPSAWRTVDGGAGTTVSLPDSLPAALRSESVRLRYRLDVSACATAAAASLWLFRVGAPYAVRADDGTPLALLTTHAPLRPQLFSGGLLQPLDDVHNGRLPALFALPPGARTVTVELLALPYIPAGLVRAEMGPTNLMLPVQAEALDSVVVHADVAAGVVGVLGLVALLLWVQRRGDASLLWLAIACGLWGLRGIAYFGHAVVLPPVAFEQFNPVNVLLTGMALAASVLSLLGGASRPERITLLAVTGLSLLAFVATHAAGLGARGARSVALASAFFTTVWLVVRVLRRPGPLGRWQQLTLVAGLLGLLGCAVHDLLVVSGALAPDAPSYVFWGFVVLLVGFAVLTGQYVVLTLNQAERSNEALEEHVQRKTHELEASYARLRAREHDTARTQERERLLRDMHDGLGAQLMTALRGIERGALGPREVALALQDGLDELRLLMDSADMGHYLPGALAAWRNRWDARLAAAGVALAWTIAEEVDDVQLSGDAALQVMRILQEAATNIVKHAQARHMAFDARVVQAPRPALRIAITDDGVGLPEGAARAGARGLKNMRHRAAQIGATLEIAQGEPGTRVVLVLPLT